MPYRSRPINWDLLVRPYMAGIAAKDRASANMPRTILSGLSTGASLFQRGQAQQQQESQFTRQLSQRNTLANRELDLRQGALDLRTAQAEQDALEGQALNESILLGLGIQPPTPQQPAVAKKKDPG